MQVRTSGRGSAAFLVVSVVLLAAGLQDPAIGLAAGSERPVSMVVIYTDDQREATLDAMPKTTSWLTRLPNGMVPNPLCCPSRASLLTGQMFPQQRGLAQQRRAGRLGGVRATRGFHGGDVARREPATGRR